MNLIDALSQEDKNLIRDYIITMTDIEEEDFKISIDEWLKYWAAANKKLYRLLGNQLRVEIPFSENSDMVKNILDEEKENAVIELIESNSEFIYHYKKIIDLLYHSKFHNEIFYNMKYIFNNIDDIINNTITTINVNCKFDGHKKTLQIKPGMKFIRALGSIINYFSEDIDPIDAKFLLADFEQFRIAHSMITNRKKGESKLIISIHPLDFITMSDNSYNWQSCMNWTHEGCYHAGTIEMMNSNNMVVCYIEGDTPYEFAPGKFWNNKRWRQLFCITKEIIVSGKSYPSRQEVLTKFLLDRIADLAKKNLNWTYQYGPQRYLDMLGADNCNYNNEEEYLAEYFNYEHRFVNNPRGKKKKIIFTTNGMYNDMANDADYPYFCYRNKVKHSIMINYSGKCNCVSCNEELLRDDNEWNYNQRFSGVSHHLCENCRRIY